MTVDLKNPLSDINICRVLVKKRLISKHQAKEILSKSSHLKKKLHEIKTRKKNAGVTPARLDFPVTIIDVVDSLKMKRNDKTSVSLDEENIYQSLADEWGVPYKKIDPVRLDLNVVTTTSPHTFAMKHLVLPISVRDGRLTVATPNPFNVEILEDIARATHLKV